MTGKRKKPLAAVDFIESMECMSVAHLPDGPQWTYELKLDGFPAGGGEEQG